MRVRGAIVCEQLARMLDVVVAESQQLAARQLRAGENAGMRQLIDQQPDDSSYEELVRELAFSVIVRRGLKDSDERRTISKEGAVQPASETICNRYTRGLPLSVHLPTPVDSHPFWAMNR